MIDYAKNYASFTGRDDYELLTGQQTEHTSSVRFKELNYSPRKVKPIPAVWANKVIGRAKGQLRDNIDTALYIHIPFCRLRCTYCGFYKQQMDEALLASYVQGLLQELKLLCSKGLFVKRTIKAVFFGGGTPSVLVPEQIAGILAAVKECAKLSDDCEITFESSISDLTEEKVQACLDGGVNRFSFGVQTFADALRHSLGRPAGGQQVEQVLRGCAATGARVIIDLIYGLPGQTEEVLLNDCQRALDCGVAGLDLYKLQLLPNSPLGRAIEEGRVEYTWTDEQLAELFMSASTYLSAKGARSISRCHWAVSHEEESRYNSMVKRGDDLIAIGSACGGRLGSYQYMKLVDEQTYLSKLADRQWPIMAFSKQQDSYRLLEALSGQCDRGCLDFSILPKYAGLCLEELLEPLLKKWQELCLLQRIENIYVFTDAGRYYSPQLERVLLVATEYALYGKPGILERCNSKIMSSMKNMK